MTSPGSGLDMVENSSSLITKRKIQEMVAQIDPSERLEPEVEDVRIVCHGSSLECLANVSLYVHSTTLESQLFQIAETFNRFCWNWRTSLLSQSHSSPADLPHIESRLR